MKKILGCLGFFILLLLLSVVGVYYLMMHTPYPLRAMAKTIEQEAAREGLDLKIGDIDGSFAKGFRFKSIGIKTEDGEFQLGGMGFKYSGFWDLLDRKLIIYEVYVEEMLIATDFSKNDGKQDGDPSDEDTPDPIGTAVNRGSPAEQIGRAFDVFRIDEIRFSDITLRDSGGAFEFQADEMSVRDIKVEDGSGSMGEIVIDTNMLVFKTEAIGREPPAGTWYERNFVFEIKPPISDKVLTTLPFTGYLKMGEAFQTGMKLRSTIVPVEITTEGNNADVKVTNLMLGEYLKDYPAPDIVSFSAQLVEAEDKKQTWTVEAGAALTLNGREYRTDSEQTGDGQVLRITVISDDITIELSILPDTFGLPSKVSCGEELKTDKCIAKLLYGYTDTSVAQQAEIDAFKAKYMVAPKAEAPTEETQPDKAEAGENDGEL